MNRNNLFLSVPLAGEFLRLVVSFAENASLIFGLTAKQSLATALAAEEVFMHAVNFSIFPEIGNH